MRRVAIAPIVGILLAGLTSTVAATNAGTNACSSAAPCLSGINSAPAGSSGAGVKGMATNSYGLRGISTNSTAVLGQSGAGSIMYPGVEGESTNNNGADVAGGFGLTGMSGTAPAYGVYALGTAVGVYGKTTSSPDGHGFGVFGIDTTKSDVDGHDLNSAVAAQSINGNALVGEVGSTFQYPQPAGGLALFAANFNQHAITAAFYGANGDQLNLVNAYDGYLIDDASYNFTVDFDGNETLAGGLNSEGLVTESYPSSGHQYVHTNTDGGYLIDGAYQPFSGGSSGFNFDTSGNEKLTGTLNAASVVTSKGTYARTRGISGEDRLAYGARTTSPTIEDVGEGQLVGGSAFVRLDADLADVIDRRLNYFVFITPEGDSNQLYVTQKSPSGFVVREAHGGRSTVAFQYRLVAKPFDQDGRRLAAMPIEKPFAPPAKSFERFAPPFTKKKIGGMDRALHLHSGASQDMDPLDRLKRRLGPAKFAAELAEFERQQRR